MKGYPVLVLGGKKKSGKSTVSTYLREKYDAAVISQSAPMKRFAAKVGVPLENLWGSSEQRELPLDAGLLLAEGHGDVLNACRELSQEVSAGYETFAAAFLIWYIAERGRALASGTFTARRFLQQLGTKCGRALHPDIWADCAERYSICLLNGTHSYTQEGGLQKGNSPRHAPPLVVIDDGRFRNEVLKVKRGGGGALLLLRPETDGDGSTHASETSLETVPRQWWDTTILNDDTVTTLHYRLANFMFAWFL